MYNVFVEAMNEVFDLSTMLAKIDYHHIRGRLTDAEREELVALARSKANPYGGVDVMQILADHDARLRKLEGTDDSAPGEDNEDTTETVPAYVPGKWYYKGDKVSFGGTVYVCAAPDKVVCTWSPEEYPAYWAIEE